MELETILRDAVVAKRVLTIIFHGGDRPGAARAIYPIGISTRYAWGPQLECICLETIQQKSFRLDAIELPRVGQRIWFYNDVKSIRWLDEEDVQDATRQPEMEWPEVVDDDPAKDERGFRELAEEWSCQFADLLRRDGFIVDVGVNPPSISVWSVFKNGKRRRTPLTFLAFDPSVLVAVKLNHGKELVNLELPAVRPWKTEDGRFRSLTRAFKALNVRATTLARNGGRG